MAALGGVPIVASPWNTADHVGVLTFSNGDKTATKPAGADSSVRATTAKTSGKWYWEVLVNNIGNSTTAFNVGAMKSDTTLYGAATSNTNDVIYRGNGQIFINALATYIGVFSTYTTNDVLGFALDVGTDIKIYKNNTLIRTQAFTHATVKPYLTLQAGGSGGVATIRTTAALQTYSPPATYSPWDS